MSWKAGLLACAGCFLSIYLGIKGILLIPDESLAYTSGLTVYILFAFVVSLLRAIAKLIREGKPKNLATRFIAFLGSADVGESK